MLKRNYIVAKDSVSEKLLSEIKQREDVNGLRMRRLLELPDLSRKENSPIKFIADKILDAELFKDFDIVETSEIVPADISFDLFDFPKNHPARTLSDTYFVNEKNILRTHTTVMWYYYLADEQIKEKIKNNQSIGSLSFGKVYRKDEIDRNHFPVFHQIDGWYLCPKEQRVISTEDLQEVLIKIARAVFGQDVKHRFNEDTFPYTHPSLEMEIEMNGKWLEVLGSGVVRGSVLEKLGVDSTKYNGWAFGFGLERLAMIKMDIPDIRIFWSADTRITSQFKDINSQYKEVSKYPMTYRDISFIIDKDVSLNNYYEIVRDCAGDLVEEVKLLDKYENEEKFGKDKISYTFRIVYRSPERTLTNDEVNQIQEKIIEKTKQELNVLVR
jgi:phenylalanyl-tRNA synthetase alpha chain